MVEGGRASAGRSPGMRRIARAGSATRRAGSSARGRSPARTSLMRALVTGGAGFLGSFLVERLRERGDEVVVPRRAEYDLTRWDDAERLLDNARPELVFHLAAEVGGIGANRANPGRYWYANLFRGAHVLELSRLREVEKLLFVAGTVCACPESLHRISRRRSTRTSSGTVPGGDERALTASRRSRCSWAARPTESSTGSMPSTCSPRTFYGPVHDNHDLETSHVVPALIRKMLAGTPEVVLWGDGSADARVPLRRGRGRRVRARRCGPLLLPGRSRTTSAREPRSRSASSPRPSPSSRDSQARTCGTGRCRTASRAAASTRPGRTSSSASRREPRSPTASSARSPGTERPQKVPSGLDPAVATEVVLPALAIMAIWALVATLRGRVGIRREARAPRGARQAVGRDRPRRHLDRAGGHAVAMPRHRLLLCHRHVPLLAITWWRFLWGGCPVALLGAIVGLSGAFSLPR